MKQWQDMTPEEQYQLRHDQWKAMFDEMASEGCWGIVPLWQGDAPPPARTQCCRFTDPLTRPQRT